MISFKILNDEWMVSADFFTSNEARELLEQTKAIELLEQPWILRIKDKDKSLAGQTAFDLLIGHHLR